MIIGTILPADIAISFAGTGYSPAATKFAEDMGVSALKAVLPLSMYVLGYGIGPMVMAPLSEVRQSPTVCPFSAVVLVLPNSSSLTVTHPPAPAPPPPPPLPPAPPPLLPPPPSLNTVERSIQCLHLWPNLSHTSPLRQCRCSDLRRVSRDPLDRFVFRCDDCLKQCVLFHPAFSLLHSFPSSLVLTKLTLFFPRCSRRFNCRSVACAFLVLRSRLPPPSYGRTDGNLTLPCLAATLSRVTCRSHAPQPTETARATSIYVSTAVFGPGLGYMMMSIVAQVRLFASFSLFFARLLPPLLLV
jgi:hypothetical protein